jgi:hypothetical protein
MSASAEATVVTLRRASVEATSQSGQRAVDQASEFCRPVSLECIGLLKRGKRIWGLTASVVVRAPPSVRRSTDAEPHAQGCAWRDSERVAIRCVLIHLRSIISCGVNE